MFKVIGCWDEGILKTNLDSSPLYDVVSQANDAADIVIIDTPGDAYTMGELAMQMSNFVLIPMHGNVLNAAPANETIQKIKQYSAVQNREIPYGILLTMTNPLSFQTTREKAYLAQMGDANIPIILLDNFSGFERRDIFQVVFEQALFLDELRELSAYKTDKKQKMIENAYQNVSQIFEALKDKWEGK